jgi:ABC-2 type transport system ATP-binding protein
LKNSWLCQTGVPYDYARNGGLAETMIELSHLRKEYDDLIAVEDLNLTIPTGEIYGLIGPNGAGKTTTIRMTCGLLSPTQGSVRVAGVDVLKEPEQAQQHIGYLSDFFSVYETLKVWEYLDYFAHAYKMPQEKIPARVTEVIAQVGLEVKRDVLIRGLSRGMKQRLGIGRAIIHQPKLLVLDEPASGLDPKARFDLRNLLRSLCDQGTTVVVSSHILTELEGFCTSIGIMEKGSLVRSGRIEDVTAAANPSRTLRIRWLGDSSSTVQSLLQQDPLVSGLTLQSAEGQFQFAGTEDQLAKVLNNLITVGIKITSFAESRQTVEDLYMKLSGHQVM